MPDAIRNDSATIVQQGRFALICDRTRTGEPGEWLFDPTHYERHGSAQVLRGGRDSVHFVCLGAEHWVLRRYRRGGLPGRVVSQRYVWPGLFRTRPFREYRLLERLHGEGFPVPAPVAAGVWRAGAAYTGAIAITRIEGVRTLGERLEAAPAGVPFWTALGTLLGRLHASGVHHPDLNVANVLVADDDALWLIDFDRARERAPDWLLDLGLARLRRSFRRRRDAAALFHYDDVADWQTLTEGYRRQRSAG
ncbi:3-deoxy-D-manno-octulosonic acid kinase [Algiphilus sp.]|uniref:3-deoxy-D-manno-octulosonic acid kinase n=1 Tax=Algiphilus sp. TaxID=1872431 RepID=UPI0025BDFE75|nr:3-deoxy-D-manno-octulosonic acid kinase [Algiphilus sp.]MCK5771468.1 3-deoxy-D-manno-octulosonic acid kinase [Algiphilus sp.]